MDDENRLPAAEDQQEVCLMNRYVPRAGPVASGRVVVTGFRRKEDRFQLDYASWYARLAAPGSRIEPTRRASKPIVHLDTVSGAANPIGSERLTA